MDTVFPSNLPTFMLRMVLACSFAFQLSTASEETSEELKNNLNYAVAWKQTAAEYRALYHQGFNLARMQVELALAKRDTSSKPLAIVTDVDDTLLLSGDYWGYLVQEDRDFFSDEIWDEWIPENRSVASPGSLQFIQYCRANDVEVFYVTSRDQGEDTFHFAEQNLISSGFPDVDQTRLSVLRETSNKQSVQDKIAEEFEIVVFLGDNLNDFRRKFYSSDIDQRIRLMEEDSDKFGVDYVLFPNPTDGHWIRAIFGESEPPANEANRAILKAAAARQSWSR